ncbi:MAG TPA: outer membrane protein assembly factor BamD [Vicinamibacterales bacterium]|jgi:outer membrane protein assembly factor BamD|nr:outer membrane protein assembly factor BamD [Vicinamibacterales bacterium]
MAFDHPRTRLIRVRLLVGILLVCIAPACGSGPKRPPVGTLEPDKFLWERGTEELNKKHWLTSREYYRQLMDSYPQSQYRADAKLGLADSYLGEHSAESTVLAINEFREFLSYYPTHRRAYYAQYKLGMCHFYQMHGPDRDQSETLEAIAELTTFVTRYGVVNPNDPDAEARAQVVADGKAKLREARDRLSDADYRVGYFYLKTQKFPPAAIDRFKDILQKDPEYSRRDAVYFYMAQAYVTLKRTKEALPLLDRLIEEFETSEYLEEAKKLSETLKAEEKKAKNGSVSHDS